MCNFYNSPSFKNFKRISVKTYIGTIKKASKTEMIHKSQNFWWANIWTADYFVLVQIVPRWGSQDFSLPTVSFFFLFIHI